MPAVAALLLSSSRTRSPSSRADIRLTIIERAGQPGRGIAYGTSCNRHLLNVRVSGMSADDGDADHLSKWLARNNAANVWQTDSFLPRTLYGAYLRDVLEAAGASGRLHLSLVSGTALRAVPKKHGWKIALADGPVVQGDVLVLATGERSAGTDRDARRARRCVADHRQPVGPGRDCGHSEPRPRAASRHRSDGGRRRAVAARPRSRRTHQPAVSRHGLLPACARRSGERPLWIAPPYPASLPALFRFVRQRVRQCGDEHEIEAELDALRPILGTLWSSLSLRAKKQFVHHASARWNVYRHRMAPEIGETIAAAIERGQLEIRDGGLQRLRRTRRGFEAIAGPSGDATRITAQHLINCTGPASDPARSGNPLLKSLLKRKLVRSDALKLGLDVDERSRLFDADGRAREDAFALGALTKGRFWEITAIPEIRAQAASVARSIAAI